MPRPPRRDQPATTWLTGDELDELDGLVERLRAPGRSAVLRTALARLVAEDRRDEGEVDVRGELARVARTMRRCARRVVDLAGGGAEIVKASTHEARP
jgi:metal-responsive CopG/Arc/MetJ family transcriptional regulator